MGFSSHYGFSLYHESYMGFVRPGMVGLGYAWRSNGVCMYSTRGVSEVDQASHAINNEHTISLHNRNPWGSFRSKKDLRPELHVLE